MPRFAIRDEVIASRGGSAGSSTRVTSAGSSSTSEGIMDGMTPEFLLDISTDTGEPPRLDHVHWVSLESAAPWAAQFVKRHREENSTIQREYARRRYTCIAGRVSEKGRMTHLHGGVCRDFYTAYKTAALTDAVARGVASYVLWLDYDTWFQRPLDAAFWRWMSMFDVATIGQKPPRNPETGIVMMHTGRARRFAERLRDGYEDPAARLAAGGVNDVQLFGSLLTRMQGEVHAGFFAVGCRSLSSTDQWVVESRPYKQTAHHYCAHEAPNVSPWNIFEYIQNTNHYHYQPPYKISKI